ncbi:metallophosphoesterase family protein [Dietzia massiliensis]|uniref:metallophosphoesterase family protein n=1 Tax=Dietzia massiliensis TaxID=2697499 RepID=UPI001BCB9139|nr:metallophosphoesterase [Dietzia massiliensis]MBS7548004.1 metallophosphoesterase [Dietzia massiliensis]
MTAGTGAEAGPSLRAVSDLHVGHRGNADVVDDLQPGHPGDWLIVAGDVAEKTGHVVDALERLAARFERVIWVPGNHELWIGRDDEGMTSTTKYDRLVEACRAIGVDTPEDPYPLWTGPGGPAWVVPMFLFYDYSWTPVAGQARAEALARARERRVVASDEFLIDPGPFGDAVAWCRERLVATTTRLARLDPAHPTVLINHWPLLREPTRVLRHPDFALWCGTEQTADWHRRYRATACVYGHLHIPRTTVHDGVRFEEVSLGYPREWGARGRPEPLTRQILPAPDAPQVRWVRGGDGMPRLARPGESAPELEEER